MTFTYTLTQEELDGITDYTRDCNAKLKNGQSTTMEKEMEKILRKFLKSTYQRLEYRDSFSIRTAFKNSNVDDKKKIKDLLKLKD